MDLSFFLNNNILDAGTRFFEEVLEIKIAPASRSEIDIKEFLKEYLTDEVLLNKIADARLIGMVNDLSIGGKEQKVKADEILQKDNGDYDMLIVFGIELPKDIYPTRRDISRLTRALNRRSASRPVVLLTRYSDKLTFSAAERGQYNREGQKGEKVGRISILRDIDLKKNNVHSGHERIILQLRINPLKITGFRDLYDQWLEVFNISILNKEFYNELFVWYLWAVKTVSFPNNISDKSDDTVYNSENVIRLLTRLIFIWFVKEKNLIPEILFNRVYLSGVIKNFIPVSDTNSDYYKAILQNLFFATLNTEMPKDGGVRKFIDETKKNKRTGYSDEYMDHLSYRYRELFTEHEKALSLFENIPFLNGGLFECLDHRDPETDEEIRIDGFSSKLSKQPTVPNILFFGNNSDLDLSGEFEDGKKHKHSKARGIINILNSYKFTIEENTPLEQEIALDPELLGKIFENLLASYNPETRTTARKQTGSYYTPREIVNYMVDESLIAYLKNKLTEQPVTYQTLGNLQTNFLGNEYKAGQLDMQAELAYNKWKKQEEQLEEKLHELFSYENEENPFKDDKESSDAIIAHLSECKILDPACGSGAFPMGMLHKIVLALGKLDPCNYLWKQAQLDKAIRDRHRAEEFEDEALKSDAVKRAEEKIKYIEESFGNTGHELDYARKLFLIENCIYGVDIQQVAVQISKLRFFISLMVDQKVNDEKINRNILSLPNLETKFVAANTLIPIDKPQQLLLKDPEVERYENILREIHHKIFYTRGYAEKKKLKKEELDTRKHLRKLFIEKAGYKREAAETITKWNPFDPLKAAPFFDPGIMFTISGNSQQGWFNIIIGNPPYIQLQKEHGKLASELSNLKYETFERTGDIYTLFYEKGFKLLVTKGIHVFITSSQWMKAAYGKSLRKYLLKFNPIKLVLLGPRVFEKTTVDTNILISQKSTFTNSLKGIKINGTAQVESLRIGQFIKITNTSDHEWILADSKVSSLKNKIVLHGKKLKDWDISINFGIKTGLNEAFIIDQVKRDELINADPNSQEVIKPILRGREISKYLSHWNGVYIIATFPALNIKINNYTAIKNYLESFLPRIEQSGIEYPVDSGIVIKSRKKTVNKWFETQDPISFYKEFQEEKLIWKRIGSSLRFSYSESEIYCLDSTCIATGEKIKYLTALLNSKLSKYFLYETAPRTGMGDLIISVQALEPLYVHYPNYIEEEIVVGLFDEIYDKKRKNLNSDTYLLENRIDTIVFKINHLDFEECKIIDPQIEKFITREDYERMSIEELSEYEIKV